jgi:predicted lipid-binding transport protein (Tim44 family)
MSLVLAAAGGGSSGFGGGGGGGGFSGGGGGGGFGGGGSYGGGGTGSALVAVVIVLLVLGFFLFAAVSAGVAHARYTRKRRERVKAVKQASYEAAEDDAWFAADAVEADATTLFATVQGAWDARDRDKLASLVGHDLMVEWTRRLDDFDSKGWHNRVSIISGPRVEYVGMVNREDDAEDRVVVRIEATLRDVCETESGTVITHSGSTSETSALCEYWTLARTGDHWTVASIEQRAEGDHHLDGELVASPWSDTQQLHDEAVVESAVADKVAHGFTTADIASVDYAGGAREEALDLSLADGRFAPDVLEAAVRAAVGAWAEAVDGADDALLAIATPQAAKALLFGEDGGEHTRVVIRGARIERVAIEGVDAQTQPAQMTVSVTVQGVRYVEDRDTAAVLSGDKSQARRFGEHWVLALDGPDTAPWRLVSTSGAVTA